jgi:hypothetical protein
MDEGGSHGQNSLSLWRAILIAGTVIGLAVIVGEMVWSADQGSLMGGSGRHGDFRQDYDSGIDGDGVGKRRRAAHQVELEKRWTRPYGMSKS